MTNERDLISRFTYHPPKDGQAERYDQLRDGARLVAGLILDLTPGSREQDLAITRLEEALFWATAAIARNE
jgi:hypothetical protein